MHKKYYKRWKLVMNSRFGKSYIKKSYQKSFSDISYFTEKENPFDKEDFTAFLCGVYGESTALLFADFVFDKNPNAGLIILDINPTSIEACKKTLSEKYSKKNIIYLTENALENSVESNSVDYIETDGFLQFFEPKEALPKMISEWKRVLKPNGFITTKDITINSWLDKLINKILIFGAKHWLKVTIYPQELSLLEKLYFQNGLFVTYRKGLFPSFRRFAIFNINQSK